MSKRHQPKALMNHILKRQFTIILFSFLFLLPPALASQNQNPTVLITGANRGIGLALAKKFHQQGYQVIATAREPKKAEALNQLGVRVEQLDIANQVSINALKTKLRNQPIDILLNNAGVMGHGTRNFEDLKIDKLARTFEVNSLGALRVIQTLMPNLQKGSKKTIASVSSRMGSIEENTTGGGLGYRASKSALNSFNKSLSIEFADLGYVFVVLHPGWVRTDMTSSKATFSPEESAIKLFQVVTKLNKSDNGKFYDLYGQEVAW